MTKVQIEPGICGVTTLVTADETERIRRDPHELWQIDHYLL